MFLVIPLALVLLHFSNSSINAQQTYTKQHFGPQTITDEIVDLQGNYYRWIPFQIPPDATDAILTGSYEVHGGLINQIDFYILDADGCQVENFHSSSCRALLREVKSLGNVNLSLPPGSYYLLFDNPAILGESKQTKALFQLSYDQLIPLTNDTYNPNMTMTEEQQLQASIAQEQAEFGHYTCQQLSDLLDQWEAMAGSMDEAQRLKLMHAQDQYIVRCESSMPRY
jgi:hypothetical protein